MDTDKRASAGGLKLIQMSKLAFYWLKREVPKALQEIGLVRIGFGFFNWVLLLFFLTTLYQTFGLAKTIGIYISIVLVFTIIEFFFISYDELTHRPAYTPPIINQEAVSDTEKTITITGDTDATVVLGLAGETNIANYHDTHRELETGESVTLTKSEETVTIETPTETETVNIDDTAVDIFKHDFILLEYYENVSTINNHINYGDI